MGSRQPDHVIFSLGIAAFISLVAGSPSPLPAIDPDVVVNEILYQPTGGLDDAEFVELYNRGTALVDLSGWKFTQGITFTFASGTTIAGGGYLVVCKNVSVASSLYPGVRLVGNYTGKLPDSSGRLRLETAGGIIIENFNYAASERWPIDASGRGASLERRTPESLPDYPDSWAPSLTYLGSPGRLNTQFREIVDRRFFVVGDTWKYWKGTAEPSGGTTDWTGLGFDDAVAGWLSGPTGIGYGDNDDATVLDDMMGVYSTVYLRKKFDVPDPGAILSLILTIDYDDGFVAFLNGTEVTRRGAPGNLGEFVPYTGLSTWSREQGSPETIDLSNQKGLLQLGENVFAIQVLNAPINSTDLSMKPALTGSEEVVGADQSLNRLAPVTLIARGNTWRYFKGTTEPATPLGAWAAPAFDDLGWTEGATRIGYGYGGEATLLSDMLNGYGTVYIRKSFTVTDLASAVSLTLGMDYDDGFIAYLNGTEVARNGAPGTAGTPVAYDQFATISHNPGTEELFDLTSRINLLVEGENVLAIQGFNRSLTSGDFSLMPALKLTRTVAGDPRALSAGISVNEVYAPGGGTGWLELYNGLDEEVDASGFGLTNDPAYPVKYVIPADTHIQSKSFLAIAEAQLGFALSRTGAIILTDGTGVVLIDGRGYSIPSGVGYSAGSFPDGDPLEFPVLTVQTQGDANAAPPIRGVVLNEIMYHPGQPHGSTQLEWVELYNGSGHSVPLTGWKFTKGIEWSFPAGASIAAGGYLVISNDPAALQAKYGLSGVLGSYASVLPDDDGAIELRDDFGNLAQRVHYSNDGEWPAAAGGTGPSAELVNPGLDNAVGQAWAASSGEGTPGAANSRFDSTPQPVVSAVRHSPAVPRSSEPVTITARVAGIAAIFEVRLVHRLDGAPAFDVSIMADDGAHGDGAASDGIYGIILPARPSGTVVEFFIEGEDSNGRIRAVPSAAPSDNFLYQVDDAMSPFDLPVFRVVMTAARLAELGTRDVSSDALLPATVIAGDGIHYRAGIRYNGSHSWRLATPKSYRIQLPGDDEIDGVRGIDLNGYKPAYQEMALGIFRGIDVPAPLARPVHLVVGNAAPLVYLRAEAVDLDFLRRNYPTPAGGYRGNLYFGSGDANLDDRGSDKESYRSSYRKVTNQEEDDYSDIIDLCQKLTNTPDATFAAVIQTAIDAKEWARFFAAHAAVSTQKNCIARDLGDDYFLYRRPSDGRFILVPGELENTFASPAEPLFRPSLAAVRRVLLNPEFTPYYYQALLDIVGSTLFPARADDLLAQRIGDYPAPDLAAISAFALSRSTYLDGLIPQDLTAQVVGFTLVRAGDTWRFFRGRSEPSGGTTDWTQIGFDDTAWESGPGPIGYGDIGLATILSDMQGNYTTAYIRRIFNVNDPSLVSSLELAIDYDDGFVAYLNGVEIGRANAGSAGVPIAYDAVASGTHEIGIPQTFAVQNVSHILVPGNNVLAIQGLNWSLTSTDMSLIPNLRTGGVVAEGCVGDLFVTGGSAILTGLAPLAKTRSIRVNGTDAAYDHLTGIWAKDYPLVPGSQTITVQAIGLTGSVIATQTLKVYSVHTLGGAVTENTTWQAAQSPFLIVGGITVADNIQLTIEAGCAFYVAPGVGFQIVGQIQALGTETQPITFDPMPCKENWGGVQFASTPDDNILRYCKFNKATALGCLWGSGSRLTLDSCHIHNITGEGINFGGCTMTIVNNLIENTNEAMSVDYCGQPVLEFNTTRNLIGKSDLCDVNGASMSHIYFNHFYNGPDDCLDFDDGSNYIEGNILNNASDQSASMVGPGTSTFYRNILYRSSIGVSSKDSHRVILDHNTIAYNTSIGARAILKTAGRGYGKIEMKNCIVWGSPTSLMTDSGGAITVSYSDIQYLPGTGNITQGPGNISADPKFVNAAANDYRLQADSPCIGAAEFGDDMGAMPYETLPRPPTNLRITGSTPSSISLAWQDNSWVETAYEVHRRESLSFTPQYLVRKGESCLFFRGRSEPSGGTLAWTGIGFDDSAWETGPTGIGYGDGDDATVLTDMQGSYTTVYLRRAFQVADPSAYTALELTIDYDDGFIAFLNGVEIARQNGGPAGTYPPYNGVASGDHEAGTPIVIEVPVTGLLVAGTNVLAIQTLNIFASSTDLSMIPELRTVDETPFELIATLSTNAHAYTDTTADRLAKNSYKVRAVNGLGNSAFSNTVTVAGGTLPNAPSDLRVTGFGPTQISLQWHDNAADETSFEMWRAEGAGDFELLASLPANTTVHDDPGLIEGTLYRYKVRARNGYGPSAFSNEVSQVADYPAAAPTNLTVTGVGLTTVGLAFQDNSEDETGFELEMKVPGGNFQLRVTLGPNVTVFNDENLESGRTYIYRVRAVSPAGPSAYSNDVTAVTASVPAAPGDLTVQDVSLFSITLAWTDRAANETSYELERRAPGETEFNLLASLPADSQGYEDTGLISGASYSYRVRAVNEFGPSPYSNEVLGTTGELPGTPLDLTVTGFGLTTISLHWTDQAWNEASFQVERRLAGGSFSMVAEVQANVVDYTDQGLDQNTTYEYRVLAVNQYGPSGYSNEVEATTARLPAAPLNLQVTGFGFDSVSLSWTDASDNEDGFEIERMKAGGGFVLAGRISQDGTAFAEAGLEQGTTYTYRVRAVNAYGGSAWSNEAEVTTGRLPAAPSSLTVAAVYLDGIQLSWIDSADNETGYELERRPAGGGVFELIAALGVDASGYLDGGLSQSQSFVYRVRAVNEFGPSAYSPEVQGTTAHLPADPTGLRIADIGLDHLQVDWTDNADNETGYRLEKKGPGDADFGLLANLPAGSTSYLDTGLLPDSTYTYRVLAVNEYGTSGWSNEGAGTTGRLPATPAGLAAAAIGLTSIDLVWTDRSIDETSFELERKSGSGSFEPLAQLPPDTTAHMDGGLEPGTAYTYRIRAVNGYGTSPWSNELEVTTGLLPAAPTGLAVSGFFLDAINLLWTDNAQNETGFELERRPAEGGGFERIATLGANTVNHFDGGLPPSRSFVYRVRAVNQWGFSDWSNEVSGTTGHLPADPGDLTVSIVSLTSLHLAWTDNADNEMGYELERQGPGGHGFQLVTELPAGSTEYLDSGLEAQTTYIYRVRAVNEFGGSGYSTEVPATTPHVPGTPADLRVALALEDSLELAWNDSSDNETGFELERMGPGDSGFHLIVLLAAGTGSYRDGGLIRGSTYSYRVRAVGEYGNSGYSNVATGITGQPPPAPENLELVGFGSGKISIAWTDRSGGTAGAEVERALEGGDFVLIASTPPGVTGYTDTTAQDGVTYRYRVRSVNAFGSSDFTNEVRARTAISVDGIDPTRAHETGGIPVVILGMNFLPDTEVLFGGVPLVDPVHVSLFEIRGTVPPHAGGWVDVRVQNSKGSIVLVGAFYYIATLRRGDTNIDGLIDISDVMYLLNALFLGGKPLFCDEIANVNGDPEVDISDAISILNFLFFSGPAPFPATADC